MVMRKTCSATIVALDSSSAHHQPPGSWSATQPVAAALEGAAGGRQEVRGGVHGHQARTAPATPAGRVAIPAA